MRASYVPVCLVKELLKTNLSHISGLAPNSRYKVQKKCLRMFHQFSKRLRIKACMKRWNGRKKQNVVYQIFSYFEAFGYLEWLTIPDPTSRQFKPFSPTLTSFHLNVCFVFPFLLRAITVYIYSDLGWEAVESRRMKARLILTYRMSQGLLGIQ